MLEITGVDVRFTFANKSYMIVLRRSKHRASGVITNPGTDEQRWEMLNATPEEVLTHLRDIGNPTSQLETELPKML